MTAATVTPDTPAILEQGSDSVPPREIERLRGEMDDLRAESDSLAFQLIQRLEEISLLKSMAQGLEVPEYSSNSPEIAAAALTDLSMLVNAEGLLLALCGGDDPANPLGTGPSFRWFGRELLTPEKSRELILAEHERARERPMVVNGVSRMPYGVRLPELHEFILVEIRNKGRLSGWLAACNRINAGAAPNTCEEADFTTVEATLLTTVASMLAAHFHNVELLRQKELALTNLVRALVNATDARDPYTCGHSERVARFARRLGKEAGLAASDCERLYLSGLLHDVGKIGIPDALLGKPGKLTEEELNIFQKHPEAGWDILHELETLKQVLPGVLHHHERIDGKGYPDGLAGDAIPMDGRILAICDAYDAMTSDRPYRNGMPQEQALNILREGSGSQWDAKLVAIFFSIMPEIVAIRNDYRPRAHTPRRPTHQGESEN